MMYILSYPAYSLIYHIILIGCVSMGLGDLLAYGRAYTILSPSLLIHPSAPLYSLG